MRLSKTRVSLCWTMLLYFCWTTLIMLIPTSEAFIGKLLGFHRVGENAGNAISEAMKANTAALSNNIQSAVQQMDISITTASTALQNSAYQMSKSVENGAQEIGSSIRKASDDLVRISDKLTSSVDRGVREMSFAFREAVQATKQIAGTLSNSLDKAVVEAGNQIENTLKTAKEIAKDLTRTADNAVGEFGASIRYLGDRIVDVSKQFNLQVDSGDLVEVSKEMKEAMIQSIKELTQNWQIAVNTADLKDAGAAAAAELSKALQNVQVKIEVGVKIDDNTRLAIKDISIAVGIAFSVLFIALVIAMKSCRSCLIKSVTSIWTEISNLKTSNENNADIECNSVELKDLKTKKRCRFGKTTKYPEDSESDEGILSTGYGTDDDSLDGEKKRAFDKYQTLSLSDYKDFPEIKKKWERQSRGKGGRSRQQ